MVRRFVKIAKHCRRLNNFNAVCVCAAGRIAAARALWCGLALCARRACVRVCACAYARVHRGCECSCACSCPAWVPREYCQVMEVVAGLQNASIFRLKKTWAQVRRRACAVARAAPRPAAVCARCSRALQLPKKTLGDFEDLKKFVSQEGNYKTFRCAAVPSPRTLSTALLCSALLCGALLRGWAGVRLVHPRCTPAWRREGTRRSLAPRATRRFGSATTDRGGTARARRGGVRAQPGGAAGTSSTARTRRACRTSACT
jgi:hypothetical protein